MLFFLCDILPRGIYAFNCEIKKVIPRFIGYTKLVGSVRGDLGWNCAHLTTIMKICTLIVLDLLNSNLPGAKADSQKGRRI